MPQQSERPRAVTVIGRIWLVLAVLLVLRATGNLIVWAVLRPAVAFCAWGLLRLRSWARPAVQTISGLALGYFVCFGLLWTWAWMRAPAESAARAHANPGLLLAAGLTLSLILAAGFATMIASLQSRRVRETFLPPATP